MGRHGGGSRSGGSRSRSSRSGSSSRSGGRGSSGARSSNKPFRGCYNRSYYHRGRYHPYYTTDAGFGVKRGLGFGNIFSLLLLTLHMCIMLTSLSSFLIHFGGKVNGNPDRIQIYDEIDILSSQEEEDLKELFQQVYDKSGMPVTIFTDDFEWKDHYNSIEFYSEELYYGIDMDESAMVILFTQKDLGGFVDWEYDMYCGDDTITCLSDATFEKLLDTFQKSMAKQDLYYALDYSWNAIMNDLAKTTLHPDGFIVFFFVLCFYGIFYAIFFSGAKKKLNANKYFRENPQKLDSQPMMVHNECPNCGAPNTTLSESCSYCGSILKLY